MQILGQPGDAGLYLLPLRAEFIKLLLISLSFGVVGFGNNTLRPMASITHPPALPTAA